MEKTEMMKKFEEETGQTLEEAMERWEPFEYYSKYMQWLEELFKQAQAKASAYDRLMSGGKKTPKEVANFYGLPIALTPHGDWLVFHDKPWASDYDWFSYCLKFGELPRIIHNLDIDFTGDWKNSLTFPDGWEEK